MLLLDDAYSQASKPACMLCARLCKVCKVCDAYPSLTCCTQFQFEAGRPNTKPVVQSFKVSAVAPAQIRRMLLQARVQSKQGTY